MLYVQHSECVLNFHSMRLRNQDYTVPTTMCTGIFTRPNIVFALIVAGCLFCVSGNTSAESLRFLDGQAYTASRFKVLTLEGGYNAGSDTVRQGGRLTLPVIADRFAFFADISNSKGQQSGIAFGEDVDYSGKGEGGGVYVDALSDWRGLNVTLRLSRNTESVDVDSIITVSGRQAGVEMRTKNTSAAVILSPMKPLFARGINGFVSVGVTQSRFTRTVFAGGVRVGELERRENDILPSLAAGLSARFGRIEIYGALEHEDGLSAGFGLRIPLTRTGQTEASDNL